MTRTHFKNANGLTESGHLSTARDMTTLGRHVFFDYPDYYNLFSRRTADAGMRRVNNTNTRFLNSYRGADGIKTGYTRAAGFNLVASAERGSERIITTVFGGRSTASRNAKVAELMNLGFRRAPSRVAVRKPARPSYPSTAKPEGAGKTIRLVTAVKKSQRPRLRPAALAPKPVTSTQLAALSEGIAQAVEEVAREKTVASTVPLPPKGAPKPQPFVGSAMAPVSAKAPQLRPAGIVLAAREKRNVTPAPQEVVTRISTSGGRHWGINVGILASRYQAERLLLKTALKEIDTLEDALRKVVNRPKGGMRISSV